jgi:hypothetical protein
MGFKIIEIQELIMHREDISLLQNLFANSNFSNQNMQNNNIGEFFFYNN